MKARVVSGLVAVAVVVGLVVWGLLSGGATTDSTASHSLKPSVHAESSPSTFRARRSGPGIPGKAWRLRLNASFQGARLDTALWATCYPWMDVATGCTNFANVQRHTEWEWYLPSQVLVRNGSLHLVAKRAPTSGLNSHGKSHVYACRSGMVTTYPGFRFKYGYIKIVAHIPAGAGLWPALWLAASNERWPPEVDILEHWGPTKNRTGVFFHPLGAPQLTDHIHMPTLSIGWHTFALLWRPSELVWYIDGYHVLTTHFLVPHQSMYLIANLAEAQDPRSGPGCQGVMEIRSVKVWQHA